MIFCVEDDLNIRELMLYALRATGYTAEGFSGGKDLFDALKNRHPDLILLDLMLPECDAFCDGIDILRKIREDPYLSDIPIMVVTAKSTEYDKVRGLDAGADDYLTKPFGIMEFLSRVRALLRRSGKATHADRIFYGDLELNLRERTVYRNGSRVSLTPKEYELLKLFLQSPGKIHTRQTLLQAIWGLSDTENTRTVDVHIGNLRTKLGDGGYCIETIRGVGYRLCEKDYRFT